MTRTAYVIGLGGTGQWITTYLKKELMEINGWVLPENVRLLGIDTQVQEVALAQVNPAQVDANRMQNLTDAKVADIRLDNHSEYCHIGGDLFDFLNEIDEEKPQYKYLNWLDKKLLTGLGRNACNTIWGAGAFRQLGRLSFMLNVETIYDKFRKDLTYLKTKLKKADENIDQLDIMISCSSAGGTGAGMLIDAAWLLRKAAAEVGLKEFILRAFIVLPTAWEHAGEVPDKRIRSYCFWRELDRFMLSSITRNRNTKIIFNPNSTPPLEVTCDTPVFDHTCLVDPKRSIKPLNQMKPEKGIFPAVSQMMSIILDDKAGARYAAHYKNIHVSGMRDLPPGAYHSTFGCYSIKVPVYEARSQLSKELAYASLEKFVQPVLSNSGVATDVRRDRNRESTINVTSATKDFLISGAQGNHSSTAFFSHIELVSVKTASGPNELHKYAQTEANAIVNRSGETFQAFLNRLPAISENDNFIAPGGPLNGIRSEHVWHICKRSRDRDRIPPSSNLADLLSCVNSLEERWFGRKEYREDPDNITKQIEVRVSDGLKTICFNEVAARQTTVYNSLLLEWIRIQLNGTNSDPILAKGGKIGFTLGALEDLLRKFSSYLAYLILVKQNIDQQKFKMNRLDVAQKSEKRLREIAGKTSFIPFWDENVDPRARDAEDNYLEKIDSLYNVYLAEQLISAIEKSLNELIIVTGKTIEEVKRWVRVLVTGRSEEKEISGYAGMYNALWGTIKESQNSLDYEMEQGNPKFHQEKEFEGVQQLIKPEIAKNHYQSNDRIEQVQNQPPIFKDYSDSDEIRAILSLIRWEVELNPSGGAILKCGLVSDQGEVTYLSNGETSEQVHRNLQEWNRKSLIPFKDLNAQHRIDLDIVGEIPNSSDLAGGLKDIITPYVNKVSAPRGCLDKSLFTRFDCSSNVTYFQDFIKNLGDIGSGSWDSVHSGIDEGVQKDSEDPYKISLLLANHLMPSSDFKLLHELEDLFIKTIVNIEQYADPSQEFNFSAEKLALKYALRKPRVLKKPYAPFDPVVASLLEERKKLLLFCLGFALGLIKRQKTQSNKIFNWVVGEGDQTVYIYKAKDNFDEDHKEPNIFEIMWYWIGGKDYDKNSVDYINFSEIEKAIYVAENTEKDKVIEKYKKATNEDEIDSLIKVIDDDLTVQRERYESLAHKEFIDPMPYTDIKDLVKIILLERVDTII